MSETTKGRQFPFSVRTMLELAAVSVFVLTLFFSRAWFGSDRYQMQVIDQPSRIAGVYVLDRATGRLSRHTIEGASGWVDLDEPPKITIRDLTPPRR